MHSATKSRYTRIWTLVVLVMLTAPPALIQEGGVGSAAAVTLEREEAATLYPWRSRSRWKKGAWRRYQRWRRRRRQALWKARRARLYLLGVRSVAGLFDGLLHRQLRYQVGSLPIMYNLLAQLQVRRIINKHVPTRAQVDIGTVALVLVLNRLQTPRALYRIADWMAGTVLVHLLDVEAAKFNDDRLARALDAIAPHIEAIWEEVLAEAIRLGGVELIAIFY